jgi:hypothetical protein
MIAPNARCRSKAQTLSFCGKISATSANLVDKTCSKVLTASNSLEQVWVRVDFFVGSGGGSLGTRVCASSALKGLACCLRSSSASQSPAGLFRNFSGAENYSLRIRSCCCSFCRCSPLEGAGRLLRTSDFVASRATRTSYRPYIYHLSADTGLPRTSVSVCEQWLAELETRVAR